MPSSKTLFTTENIVDYINDNFNLTNVLDPESKLYTGSVIIDEPIYASMLGQMIFNLSAAQNGQLFMNIDNVHDWTIIEGYRIWADKFSILGSKKDAIKNIYLELNKYFYQNEVYVSISVQNIGNQCKKISLSVFEPTYIHMYECSKIILKYDEEPMLSLKDEMHSIWSSLYAYVVYSHDDKNAIKEFTDNYSLAYKLAIIDNLYEYDESTSIDEIIDEYIEHYAHPTSFKELLLKEVVCQSPFEMAREMLCDLGIDISLNSFRLFKSTGISIREIYMSLINKNQEEYIALDIEL